MSNEATNLIKENLPKIIKNVFADDWRITSRSFISDLLSLVAYYADDDMSKEMIKDCNRLRAILLQIDEIRSILERISMISNYRCDFHHDPRCEIAPDYSFSPQFPDISEICNTIADKVERAKNELSGIDTVSICMYIRKKAVAAGDL